MRVKRRSGEGAAGREERRTLLKGRVEAEWADLRWSWESPGPLPARTRLSANENGPDIRWHRNLRRCYTCVPNQLVLKNKAVFMEKSACRSSPLCTTAGINVTNDPIPGEDAGGREAVLSYRCLHWVSVCGLIAVSSGAAGGSDRDLQREGGKERRKEGRHCRQHPDPSAGVRGCETPRCGTWKREKGGGELERGRRG